MATAHERIERGLAGEAAVPIPYEWRETLAEAVRDYQSMCGLVGTVLQLFPPAAAKGSAEADPGLVIVDLCSGHVMACPCEACAAVRRIVYGSGAPVARPEDVR